MKEKFRRYKKKWVQESKYRKQKTGENYENIFSPA